MANPSTSSLLVDQEEENLVLQLLDSLTSFAVENLTLSDDFISVDVSCSVIPPPHKLSETDASDLVEGGVFVRVHADYRGGSFGRRRMVVLGVSSRYSIGDYINGDGDEDDDEDDDDLDDELVPRSVSKKLKRDRMRKFGKRKFAKVRNSKRFPYSCLKPGCIYGKHGFGIRFRDW